MMRFSKEDFIDHLNKLGVKPGQNVLVHSGMFAFGKLWGNEKDLLDALLDYLGEKSTVVVPTFTLWMDACATYSIDTPSQRMGQLAEFCRKLNGAVRSRCPMHNHAGIGPKAKLLSEFSGSYSTGEESDFELFYNENFFNLFLGCCPADSGTYLIHIEALAAVPYREWIDMDKKVQWLDEPEKTVACQYFARKKLEGFASDDIGVTVNLHTLQSILLHRQIMAEQRLPLGRSYFGSIREMQHCLLEEFESNPYLTLSKIHE